MRIRNHIRSNLIGYFALFFSLTLGTAWALEANSVRSKHIVNGQVREADVASAEAVTYVRDPGGPEFESIDVTYRWKDGTEGSAGFYRDPYGTVRLTGSVCTTYGGSCVHVSTNGQPVVFTLPPGYRPSNPAHFIVPDGPNA